MCSSYETQEGLSTNSHLLRSQFTVQKLNSLHITLAESIQMDGEPQIELFATHQTVIEGSTVDLVCSFQDYCPSDVTWWMSEDVAGDTQTDSNGTLKPLVALLGIKHLDSLPPRDLRFRLPLDRFSCDITHVPGKELYTADTLSRASTPNRPQLTALLCSETEFTTHHTCRVYSDGRRASN